MIYADSGNKKILVQFPGNSILKFFKISKNAWVASICVGFWFSKSPRVFNFLRWSISYIKSDFHIKNLIFAVQFPGNWFGFGIILNDFWSSTFTYWFDFHLLRSKLQKNPGIQPKYIYFIEVVWHYRSIESKFKIFYFRIQMR